MPKMQESNSFGVARACTAVRYWAAEAADTHAEEHRNTLETATPPSGFQVSRNAEGRSTLAEIQFFQFMADGSLPGLKKVRIPDGFQGVLINGVSTQALGSGEYDVGTQGVASSVREAIRSRAFRRHSQLLRVSAIIC